MAYLSDDDKRVIGYLMDTINNVYQFNENEIA